MWSTNLFQAEYVRMYVTDMQHTPRIHCVRDSHTHTTCTHHPHTLTTHTHTHMLTLTAKSVSPHSCASRLVRDT